MRATVLDSHLWQLKLHQEQTIAIDELEPLPYKPDGLEPKIDETLRLSIKQVGLQDPFVVAHPPGRSKYVLIAGGNSRLLALRQLWNESRAKRYSRVRCLVAEWPGEFRACLAHLITNDVRTNASFLERARGLVHIVEDHVSTKKGRQFSQREAVSLLNDNGYPISQATFSYMVYVVQRLVPHMSEALLENLSLADVRQIREFENELYDRLPNQMGTRLDLKGALDQALASIDTPMWDFDIFLEHVDEVVKAEIGTQFSGLLETSQNNRSNAAIDSELSPRASHGDWLQTKIDCSRHHQNQQKLRKGDESLVKLQKPQSEVVAIADSTPELTSSNVRRLRKNAYELALRLCKGLSIPISIVKSDTGCGFRLEGKPLVDLAPLQQEALTYLDAFATKSEYACGATTSSGPRPEQSQQLNERTELQAVDSSSSGLVPHVNARLWVELEEQEWYTLIELWDVVRLLRSKPVHRTT